MNAEKIARAATHFAFSDARWGAWGASDFGRELTKGDRIRIRVLAHELHKQLLAGDLDRDALYAQVGSLFAGFLRGAELKLEEVGA